MLTQESDTIAAISTPLGEGAISIIRLSGTDAIFIVNKIFQGKNLTEVTSHTINYGHIVENGKLIDEVLVSLMRSPSTFTREDIVEINTHGGIAITQEILQILLRNGARLAEPGEFTKRAFLNGRIDLSQAESVMDLIRAKTDKAANIAIKQLNGSLSNLIGNIRQEILKVLAQVEVNIDYPEYDDVEMLTAQMLQEKTTHFEQLLENFLVTAKCGRIFREGLKTAIIGRPNVGKSSLLNQLLQADKAIVTDIAGTTRDTITDFTNINGIPLELIDTAGIHKTDDFVEKIGIERSIKAMSEADLVLLILDSSSELTEEDLELLKLSSNSTRIILLNKTDLPERIEVNKLPPIFIRISTLKSETLDTLKNQISTLFFNKQLTQEQDSVVLSNARHISLVEQALIALKEAKQSLLAKLPIDLVQIDITRCWQLLGEITGDGVPDELITQLFSQFCLGK